MRINSMIEALGVPPMLQRPETRQEDAVAEMDAVRLHLRKLGSEPSELALLELEFALAHGLPTTHAVIPLMNPALETHFALHTAYIGMRDELVVPYLIWQLQLALRALGIGAGDKVIVPGLSRQAIVGAVLAANADPIMIDVDRRTATLDPDLFEAYLKNCLASQRPLPRAIVVEHLCRSAANMDRFVEICCRFGVFLIEDATHAHGAAWNGRPLGTFGVMGVFSNEGSATLASGQGGVIVTGVPVLDQRLRAMVSVGRTVEGWVSDLSAEVDELTAYWRSQADELGLPSLPIQGGSLRMLSLIAAVLASELERFPAQHEQQGVVLAELERRLQDVVGIEPLAVQPELTSPVAYMPAFEFEPSAFAGMDGELFRQVLSYLLGGHVVCAPHHPPLTRLQYPINEADWDRIDRFVLPVARHLFEHLVVVGHLALGAPGFADALIEALNWMRENAERIVAAAA